MDGKHGGRRPGRPAAAGGVRPAVDARGRRLLPHHQRPAGGGDGGDARRAARAVRRRGRRAHARLPAAAERRRGAPPGRAVAGTASRVREQQRTVLRPFQRNARSPQRSLAGPAARRPAGRARSGAPRLFGHRARGAGQGRGRDVRRPRARRRLRRPLLVARLVDRRHGSHAGGHHGGLPARQCAARGAAAACARMSEKSFSHATKTHPSQSAPGCPSRSPSASRLRPWSAAWARTARRC